MKATVIGLSSPLGIEKANERYSQIIERIRDVIDESLPVFSSEAYVGERLRELEKSDLILAVVLTGGTEHLILKLSEANKPVILLTTMFFNSFPAAIEAVSKLKSVGYGVAIFNIDGEENIEKFRKFIIALKSIVGKKILMIGDPSPWLVYSTPNIEKLKGKFGITVDKITIEQLIERYGKLGPAQEVLAEKNARMTEEVGINDFEKVGKIHSAIENLLKEKTADAFTIKCFDLLEPLGTTPCLSLSIFNDKGVIAGCEGDVPATVAMLIAKAFSGKPAFMANILKVEEDVITLAHCTIPRKLTESYTLRTHFESGIGIGVEGKIRSGERVTVLRVSPMYDEIRVGEGTILDGDPFSNDLCRTQVKIRLDKEAVNLLKDPMGNHQIIAFGEIKKEIEMLGDLLGIKVVDF
ncbi:MAG: hypothetical protein ACP6IP_03885 [Candidatus Njordarchaeia archaeon]